jgi:hypothetical protein
MITKRLRNPNTIELETTNKKLEEFSVQGLRTLLFAKKEISKEFYAKWEKLYVNALTKLETVEKEEKERIKGEVEMMQIKRRSTKIIGEVNLKDILNVQKLGNVIIDAEEQQGPTEEEDQIEAANDRLKDNLILTDHQRQFLKLHK